MFNTDLQHQSTNQMATIENKRKNRKANTSGSGNNKSRSGHEFYGWKVNSIYASFESSTLAQFSKATTGSRKHAIDQGPPYSRLSSLEPNYELYSLNYNNNNNFGNNSFSNIVVKEVSSGKSCVTILSQDGGMYFMGENTFTLCGAHDGKVLDHFVTELTRVGLNVNGKFVTNFLHAGNGMFFMVALTSDYLLVSSGSNECGQRGVGQGSFDSFKACEFSIQLQSKKDEIVKGIQKIACGYQHCIILSGDGTMVGTGCSYQHQLGEIENGISYEFTEICKPNSKVPIVDVQCGHFCSSCIDQNGMVYVLGLGDYTRLVEGHTWTKLQTFINDPVQYMIMSCSNSFFRTTSGSVMHNFGVDGMTGSNENLYEFEIPNVKYVFGKENFFAVTDSNEMYLSGGNGSSGIIGPLGSTDKPWSEYKGLKNVLSPKSHFFIVDAINFILYIVATPNEGQYIKENLKTLLERSQYDTEKKYFLDIIIK